MDSISALLRLTGRVQGVFFRLWAVEHGQKLGLAGWVRNRTDGSVEILCTGARPAMEEFLRFMRSGSPYSRVEDLQVSWDVKVPSGLKGFSVRPTFTGKPMEEGGELA